MVFRDSKKGTSSQDDVDHDDSYQSFSYPVWGIFHKNSSINDIIQELKKNYKNYSKTWFFQHRIPIEYVLEKAGMDISLLGSLNDLTNVRAVNVLNVRAQNTQMFLGDWNPNHRYYQVVHGVTFKPPKQPNDSVVIELFSQQDDQLERQIQFQVRSQLDSLQPLVNVEQESRKKARQFYTFLGFVCLVAGLALSVRFFRSFQYLNYR